ncbi:hypothetical protein ASPCADRAFT_133351 [Aspergillus carbonarius ITEM 5010]|uniref:Uncharacterized protein n=1 Tax=Aspergillus carbonarius (strain ITEM 5010) TaxID=602072 RepID=A0A1R3RCW7_ASPC5|nr:hypothetical protein ASPCADRAFT_133351 [Aspergillus carbonarius ITEM 5010]
MLKGCASGLTFSAGTHAYPPTVVVLVDSVGWTCGRDMTGVDQGAGRPPSYRSIAPLWRPSERRTRAEGRRAAGCIPSCPTPTAAPTLVHS